VDAGKLDVSKQDAGGGHCVALGAVSLWTRWSDGPTFRLNFSAQPLG